MPVISSTYWNEIHGSCAEEAKKDLEAFTDNEKLGKHGMVPKNKAIKHKRGHTTTRINKNRTYKLHRITK